MRLRKQGLQMPGTAIMVQQHCQQEEEQAAATVRLLQCHEQAEDVVQLFTKISKLSFSSYSYFYTVLGLGRAIIS
ncbi:unnamed protein product [Amoebophrya sp. A25]|nr:unnamed protein product [Amoebophrya sp. A25]|eukprot:GSA25T00001571001.1